MKLKGYQLRIRSRLDSHTCPALYSYVITTT